jgi:septal ring factor EnvC (AmiA/AmiB activator)
MVAMTIRTYSCLDQTCYFLPLGIFERRWKELESAMQASGALKKRLTHENYDLEARIRSYEQERTDFEEARVDWKEESERAKQDIIEQNDRLTVLSQRLSGTKVCWYNAECIQRVISMGQVAFSVSLNCVH